jgi:AcrR family transcriptional regulator
MRGRQPRRAKGHAARDRHPTRRRPSLDNCSKSIYAQTALLLIGQQWGNLNPMPERGLREIKKEATARALAESAFELASERGMDGFGIADVVQRAGYARRTFANHFSCKEEAVAAALFAGADTVAAFVAELPEDTSLLDALHELLRSQLSAEMFERVRELTSLCQRYPALEPHVLAAVRHMRQASPEAWSEFTRGRYSDQYVQVLFAAVCGTISLLFDGSLDVLPPGHSATGGAGALTFEGFLDTTFDYLRTGF